MSQVKTKFIQNNAVTNAKAAQMAANTIKGNNTGSTANPLDLTATQATAMLNVMVGDSGSGGTKGLVPAPAAGDAAAGKYLNAGGTYSVPPGAGITDLTGDVTATGPGFVAATISAGAVSNSKMANMAASTIKGNNTGSSAAPIDLTVAEVKTLLNLAGTNSGDVTLAAVGSSPNANGASLSTQVLTLQPADASNPGVVTASAQTLAGVKTFSSAPNLSSLTASLPLKLDASKNIISQAIALGGSEISGTLGIGNGGTGQTTASTAFNALSPMTTQGDVIYGGASGAGTRLALGSANQVFSILGAATSPSWNNINQSPAPNYIRANPNAETDTTGWATYADTAANIPADGTGGTATGLTFSRSTSSPLRNTASFTMVQTNSTNIQGKGVSYDFTIDSADQAQMLEVSFNFNASSTFVAGNGLTAPLNDGTTTTNAGNSDVEVFIYDVTNSKLIYVTPQTVIANGSNNFRFTGSFQSASNSTSYRLIFHVATANANATGWTFKFDNVFVAPQVQTQGPAVGDWVSYTPTMTGFGTVSSTSFVYRRVGDSVHIRGGFVSGTSTAVKARVSLPSGMTIDTAKSTTDKRNISGMWALETSSGTSVFFGSFRGGVVTVDSATSTSELFLGYQASSALMQTVLGNDIATSGDGIAVDFIVPVSGWASNLIVSNDSDTRLVSAEYTSNGGQSITADTTNLTWSTAVFDTHAAWNGTTFTAPVSGVYNVMGALLTTANVSFGQISIYVNGTLNIAVGRDQASDDRHRFFGSVKLTAGDALTIRVSSNCTLSNSSTQHWISISKQSGPAIVAASEKVYLQYTDNGGQSLTADTTNITFSTKLVDSHNAWSGTLFTAPRSGFYLLQGKWRSTTSSAQDTDLYKNGTKVLRVFSDTASSQNHEFVGSYYLVAGDTLSIRAAGSATLESTSTNHWISISSQG